ncbi:AMP-binding protein [Quisquiliibacterium transsilvanicum]|uniref:Long-chain acyl-CoA synthetase n=1 Tax=Quisquiliibacterium transsilvanicum TaxID=1549638 RepID=A0A7W8HIB5_9BURK|nr:AMP-binding protein [Quisquiliibacterium transsilvanicum]MBB5271926.1 long-chain acyl-CoA synthetase [Quisquiliibacterium transsilvanicum]
MTLMIAPIARRRGDAPALIDEQGQRSWAELESRANRLVRALRAAGLAPGDRIALFAGNSRAVFELAAAASHAGISYVPVNWHLTVDELAHVLADSGALGLFTDTRFAGVAAQALARVPAAGSRLAVCAAIGPGQPAPAGFQDFEALVASQADDSDPPDQMQGGPMFYTSGTTGRPKGVVRPGAGLQPAEGLRLLAEGLMGSLELPPDGTTLLCGPYYHSAQFGWSFYPMLMGSTVVMSQRFDAQQTLELIDAHRVTNVHLVPTQFIRQLRLPPEVKSRFDGSSLVRVWHGAAPCPPQVKREMIDWWGPCIHEYYGSTEGSVVTGISSQEWLERPASVGRATFQTDAIILRDDGSEAAPGEQGTIYMRSRRGIDVAYHNDPDKTAEAHRGAGLFTTGDVGWIDAEGYLYLTDRKIDMIISGGVNIYPAEIEAALASHPQVQDVAVIGVPHAEFGEEVKAVVQPVPGTEAGPALAEALERHCRAALAGYKVPRSFDFRDEMPRTETGKLQKRLLRDAYWQGAQRRI